LEGIGVNIQETDTESSKAFELQGAPFSFHTTSMFAKVKFQKTVVLSMELFRFS